MKLPTYKAVHQKELLLMIIQSVFPSLAKRACLPVGRVRGDLLEKLFVTSPLIPLFQRGSPDWTGSNNYDKRFQESQRWKG